MRASRSIADDRHADPRPAIVSAIVAALW